MEPTATLADLVVRDPDATDDPTGVALRSGGVPDREYDYRRLGTDANRTGNFLAHRGVRGGRTLGVADEPVPEAVLSLLAAGLLGAVVRFDPPREFDGRAVVAPTDRVGEFELPPGGQRIGYGGTPENSAVAHFEEEMWSENPTFPPSETSPKDPIVATADREFTHHEILDAARRIAAGADLRVGDVVAVRAPLSRPGTVAAGVVTPLVSGATVLLPDPADPGGEVGSVAVADGNAPEDDVVDPRDVF